MYTSHETTVKIAEFTKAQVDTDGNQFEWMDIPQTGCRHFSNGLRLRIGNPSGGDGMRQMDSFAFFGDVLTPPTDEAELIRVNLEFAEEKLARESAAFNRYRNDIAKQTEHAKSFPNSCPPPPADAVATLKRGQARCRQLKEQVDTMKQRLLEIPGTAEAKLAESKRIEREIALDRQNRLTRMQDEIAGINL